MLIDLSRLLLLCAKRGVHVEIAPEVNAEPLRVDVSFHRHGELQYDRPIQDSAGASEISEAILDCLLEALDDGAYFKHQCWLQKKNERAADPIPGQDA